MNYLTLIRANLTRNPLRTGLTGLCLIIAFLLFGLLQPIGLMFTQGPQLGDQPRLVVTPKHSTSDLLPVHYLEKIRATEGVANVTHMSWFGGTYIDAKNFFAQFAVHRDSYLDLMPEVQLSSAEREAFATTRRGAIVGVDTATKYDWKVGDQIPLIPTIWHNQDNSVWLFEIVGIFDSSNAGLVNNEGFYFGYDYFDDYRAFAKGTVGSFVVSVKSSDQITAIAKRIDATFANSSSETKTQTDREYALSFARQLGDVGLIVNAVLGAVLFTMLMLTGNTIAQATRERIPELAVMKVLGFGTPTVLVLVLLETLLLVFGSLLIGLLLAQGLLTSIERLIPQLQQLGSINVSAPVVTQGLVIALVMSLIVGLPPALRAMRLNIVDALRV